MTTTTRRRFSVAVAAVGAPPATSAVAAADPHRRWLADVEACIAETDAIYASRPTIAEQNAAQPLVNAVYDRQDEPLDKLTETRATSKDGILVQLEVVMRDAFIFNNIPADDQLPLGNRYENDCIKNIHAAVVALGA